jgi:hypothetical protein
MKFSRLYIILLLLLLPFRVSAQISHGGKPYFPQHNVLRFAGETFPYFEMPTFNLDSVMQEDRLNEGNMRGSFRFAHTFYTQIEKRRDARLTVLSDGTKIWRMGIRSEGAYSINLLLTNFELPEGGKLFVYSSDYTHVIGSFDYRNNSPEKILPIRPVTGDAVIVEYSEPANAPYEGNFAISEVNHDFRNILRREPGRDNYMEFGCMPDVLCENVNKDAIRSTVLLMINGNTACSGTLVNNTEDDEMPYILTAVHCLNDELEKGVYKNMEHYISQAGTVVVFFNYERPYCDREMKGTEEMSLAGAYPRVILEKKDVALLEMQEKPPVYYNAYYAGWNVDADNITGPYTNIHHPEGAVKKYGMSDKNISIISLQMETADIFDKLSHWEVPSWTVGSTYFGSSGSSLCESNNLVIGALTGGSSLCKNASPNGNSDYFSVLYKSWEQEDPANQLKTYLDPNNKGQKQYQGLDPNKDNPLFRLRNADFETGDSLVVLSLENSGYIFGSNKLNINEFSEEFSISSPVEILGVYLLIPDLPSDDVSTVEISLYSGKNTPEELLATQQFSPKYTNYSSGNFQPVKKNLHLVGTESFILFDEPIIVKDKFFISYKIGNSVSTTFCVYNTKYANTNSPNTAWLKDNTKGWIPASEYEPYPVKTSLAIQALVRRTTTDSIPVTSDEKRAVYYDRKSQTLYFSDENNEPIEVEVYSLTGQLWEKVRFGAGNYSVKLTDKPQGTIGITRVICANKHFSEKIIY